MLKSITVGLLAGALMYPGNAHACPDGQSEGGFLGAHWCQPNIGGEVGKTWEKGKQEVANFERDVRVWIQTGKCGGDICDAFAAAIQFGKDQVEDVGGSLERAGKRLAEGKPLDAIWHLQTDYLISSEKNAAKAAFRSRVLMATGQVAASVYGGPGGAAGYTAWLAYNATQNVGDALKAGIISGLTAAALGEVNHVELTGAQGVVAKSVLTGAINGAEVAAAGGSDSEIKTAIGLGVAAVVIREGYRQLTSFDLNDKRLRSSTGEAYCLAEPPSAAYLNQTATSGCFAPPSAYARNADGSLKLQKGQPVVDFSKLDPDRPHVGVWARQTESPLNVAAENSRLMTGISRLPGWNAMAVAHDVLSVDMNFDLLPGGVGIVPTVATIPPSLVLTYVGSGNNVHDQIREVFLRKQSEVQTSAQSGDSSTGQRSASRVAYSFGSRPFSTTVEESASPTEVLHLLCGIGSDGAAIPNQKRTDVLVSVSATGEQRGKDRRLCEVREQINGTWYELGHAHHELNYCHRVAERIARNRINRGQSCFASTGLKENGI